MPPDHRHSEVCWCRNSSCNDLNPWCDIEEAREVMEWGKDVEAVLKKIATDQTGEDDYADATKTLAILTAFHEWLWDLDDNYVHAPIAEYAPLHTGDPER